MYTIEKDNTINKLFIACYRLRFWHDESACVSKKIGLKLFFIISFLSFIVSVALGALYNDNRSQQLFSAAVSISCVVNLIKLIYILWKKDEILGFTDELGIHSSITDLVQFNEIKKKLKYFIDFSTCFIFAILGAVIFMFILSFLFWSEKKMSLKIAFPLDLCSEIGYWLGNLYLCTCTMFCVIVVSFGVIVWYLMFNCSIKYEVLGHRFRNMGSIETVHRAVGRNSKISEEEKQKIFLKEFIDLIKVHKNLIETIDRFKSFFNFLFFMQITTSGICMCFIIYGLVFADEVNIIQQALNSLAMVERVFDIFIIMYLGNLIKLSSERMLYCLFESNWIDQSKSLKKCMIILSEVLKQPQELVIGRLYPLNLETFTSIVNFAYSTFNILQNFK